VHDRAKVLSLLTGCLLLAAAPAPAQLAISQPTTRFLILPLSVSAVADSATSVSAMNVTRDRLTTLARYKVIVITKRQLCDALSASGFACDVLLDDAQARLLARLLNAQAYTTGTLERRGAGLGARIRVVDIGSSGFAFAFSIASATADTTALGDAIAQRLNVIVRAGENARDCADRRQRGAFPSALDAARKALSIEPNLTDAYLCMATVYEAQRLPPDSLIAAATRALAGDSINPTAWEIKARAYQMKGDTLRAIDAFESELLGEPQNVDLRLGVADLERQQKQYQRAVKVLDAGLARSPGDAKILDLKSRICIEGQLWRCTLDGFVAQVSADSTRLGDSTFLRAAIGAAQQVADTDRLLFFSRAAVRRFPKSADFWKVLGSAFEQRAQHDSSLWAQRQALAIDPNDVNASLLVAKAMVDGAVYDTATANRLKSDTAQLHRFRQAFATRVDSARSYLDKAMTSPDSLQQLSAAVILLTGGSKLAQAGAYDDAYAWLDPTMGMVSQRTPADTTGPRAQVRVQTSFWFGLASVASLTGPYSEMVKSKRCSDAKVINDRINRTKDALIAGARIQPTFVNTMMQNLGKFEAVMPQVKKQFKCTNF